MLNRSLPGSVLWRRSSKAPVPWWLCWTSWHAMSRWRQVFAWAKALWLDQTVAFLMALLEYAASVDHVVVVYTLAGSADAFSDQTEKVSGEDQGVERR